MPIDRFVAFFIWPFFFGHGFPGPDCLPQFNLWHELASQGFRTNLFPTVLPSPLLSLRQLSSFIDLFLSFYFPFGLTDPFVLLRPPFESIPSPLFVIGGNLWFSEDACTKVREPVSWAFSDGLLMCW